MPELTVISFLCRLPMASILLNLIAIPSPYLIQSLSSIWHRWPFLFETLLSFGFWDMYGLHCLSILRQSCEILMSITPLDPSGGVFQSSVLSLSSLSSLWVSFSASALLTFCVGSLFAAAAVLCMVGHLAASLSFSYQMPAAPAHQPPTPASCANQNYIQTLSNVP